MPRNNQDSHNRRAARSVRLVILELGHFDSNMYYARWRMVAYLGTVKGFLQLCLKSLAVPDREVQRCTRSS